MDLDLKDVLQSLEPEVPPYEWATQTDYVSNYSFVLPFEHNWDRLSTFPWYRHNARRVAYWSAAWYVVSIWALKKIMSQYHRGFELRLPLALFNAGLAIFSVFGFVRVIPEFIRSISRHGFEHSICMASFTQDHVALTWIKIFGWSKYVELIDTLLLILRKRPVSFLHWYHHASVLVFTWHGMYTVTAAGRWFVTMNYAVHSVMYTYFAWRSFGYRCPRWISMFITSMQLSQMIIGCFIGYAIFKVKLTGGQCHHTWENLYLALAIYSTYFYLFARYFYLTYLTTDLLRKARMRLPCCVDNDAAEEAKRTSEDSSVEARKNGSGARSLKIIDNCLENRRLSKDVEQDSPNFTDASEKNNAKRSILKRR